MQKLKTLLLVSVCLSSWTPESVHAAPRALDIALRNGTLSGQLLNRNGEAVPGAIIEMVRNDQIAAKAITNEEGNFSAHVSPGVYVVRTAEQAVACRVWSPGTEPPVARSSLLLVRDTRTVRGAPAPFAYWTVVLGLSAGVVVYRLGQDSDDAS